MSDVQDTFAANAAQDKFAATAALHQLARQTGLRRKLKEMLDNGADLTARDDLGRHALILATVSPDVTNVIALLRCGAKIEEPDDARETALHWAAYHHNHDVIRLLVKKGAPMEAQNAKGQTPIEAMRRRLRYGLRRGVSPLTLEDVTQYKTTIALLKKLKTGKLTNPFTRGTAAPVTVHRPFTIKMR